MNTLIFQNKFVINKYWNYGYLAYLELDISEVYCHNCKKILGKYNSEFYSETQIGEVVKMIHATHIREGHDLVIRQIKKK